MSRFALFIAGLLFGIPFVLLGVRYGAMPSEMPVLRIPAAKSVFTVFSVPLMNSIHGLMAGVMLSHARDFKNAERLGGSRLAPCYRCWSV